MKLLKEDVELLKTAQTPGEFLAFFMGQGGLSIPKKSYAEVSRRAGFSSRAFPREIVLGRRKLTEGALEKFAVALSLPHELKAILEDLRKLESASEEKSKQTFRTNIDRRIEKLLRRKSVQKRRGSHFAQRVFLTEYLPQIYASLGTEESGASFDEVLMRSGCLAAEIKASLQHMQEIGLVKYDESLKRYFAITTHAIFSELGRSDVFKDYYKKILHRHHEAAQRKMDKDDQLFFASAFCVRSSQLTTFKTELTEFMNRFVQERETSDGDQVVFLNVGLFGQ